MSNFQKSNQSNFQNTLNSKYSKHPEIIDAFPSISQPNINVETLQDQKIPKMKSPKKSQLLGRDEKISPEAIVAAARCANLEDTINNLPKK